MVGFDDAERRSDDFGEYKRDGVVEKVRSGKEIEMTNGTSLLSEKMHEAKIKRRTLSMRDDSKHVRMNPHYKKEILVSAIQEDGVEGKGRTVLRQAIRRGDLSYISEFLVRKNRNFMLNKLSCDDKEMLGELLLEFVDQPLRSEALETIREIISSIKDVDSFIEKLRDRVTDFSKLVYLKGRIDYLRFVTKSREEEEPEVVIDG